MKQKAKGSLIKKIAVTVLSAVLSVAIAGTAFAMASYSGYVIYDSMYINQSAFSSWDLAQYRPRLKEGDRITLEELVKINPDTAGWIKIDGTNIDYPVVQGKDDLEYANKDVFGNTSLSGSIYLTAANTKDFTNSFNLIYGHHMENGAMFGDIEKYEDYDYFHAHQTGILITTQGVYDLQIFARIGTDAYDSKIYSAGDRKSEDFPDFLEYVQSLAIQWQDGTDIYDITDRVRTYLLAREQNIAEYGHFVFDNMPEEAVANGMQLLALSTCADATTNGRQVLFATMKMRTEPLPADVVIDDNVVPLAVLGHGQGDYWSLLNLVCVLICIVILIPGLTSRSKFARIIWMKRANEDGADYRVRSFRIRLIIGMVLEMLVSAFAIVWFLRTENLLRRMTMVDEWTPLMVAAAAVMIVIDIIFIRYRSKSDAAQTAAS